MKPAAVASLLAAAALMAPAAAADPHPFQPLPTLHSGRDGTRGRGKVARGQGKACGGKDAPCPRGHGQQGPGQPPTERVVIVRLQPDDAGEGARSKAHKRVRPKARKHAFATAPAALCAEVAAAAGGTVAFAYAWVLRGCAVRLPAATVGAAAATLASDPRVASVEDDRPVYAQSPGWGLDRVDQCRLPLDGERTRVDATGVRVYVIDSGIYKDHEEFEDVLDPESTCHADPTGGGDPFADGRGHGTHVAGTVCGATYGVATGCDLCAIKVIYDDSSGVMSEILAGIDHAIEDCAQTFPDAATRQCVANLSFGAEGDMLNEAVANAAAAGVVVVVAAGNANADACAWTPASEPTALTVGATTRRDRRAWFSNYGACVDAYAPGSGVTSAWTGGTAASRTASGTSLASPYVAGIAAGLLREDPSLDPAGVAARIRLDAQPLEEPAQEGHAMRLATSVGNCNPPTPAPTPFSCTQEGHTSVSVDITTDRWPAETEWELANACDPSQPVVTGSWELYKAQSQLYSNSYCLPLAEYTFTIRDFFGDGLCCSEGAGGYAVNVDDVAVASGGSFAFSETKTFGSCELEADTIAGD